MRTARQGQLTISDYRGKVLKEASSTNNKAVSLFAKIPLQATKTIYSASGDWLGFMIIIMAVYFIVVAISAKNIKW